TARVAPRRMAMADGPNPISGGKSGFYSDNACMPGDADPLMSQAPVETPAADSTPLAFDYGKDANSFEMPSSAELMSIAPPVTSGPNASRSGAAPPATSAATGASARHGSPVDPQVRRDQESLILLGYPFDNYHNDGKIGGKNSETRAAFRQFREDHEL